MKGLLSTAFATVLFISLVLTLSTCPGAADQLYWWVDDQGVIHYTNQLFTIPAEKQLESFNDRIEGVVVEDRFDEEVEEGLEEGAQPTAAAPAPANPTTGPPTMTEDDALSARNQIRALAANEKAIRKIIEEKEDKLEKYRDDGYGPSDIAYLEQDIKTLHRQLQPLQEKRAEMEAALATTRPK
ncbi:MAG: DUF4124 domain-containing protein [Thermodesulfobacteriota bacterium]